MTKTFHIQLMSLIIKNKKSGFALLYAILLTSVVLVVGVALINIITRQLILTSLNRNSQIAYYNATSVRHCLDFYDEKEYFIEETYNSYGDPIKTINPADKIECFGRPIALSWLSSDGNIYKATNSSNFETGSFDFSYAINKNLVDNLEAYWTSNCYNSDNGFENNCMSTAIVKGSNTPLNDTNPRKVTRVSISLR